MPRHMTEEIFWSRVDKSGGPTDCWPWRGQIMPNGYGVVSWRRRYPDQEKSYVHRISWELSNGRTIPAGLRVLHHCDNPPCVRPEHLFIGTSRDNSLDMLQKGRDWAAKDGKVTPDMVRAIRYQYQIEGLTITEIARQRNLMVQYVWKLVHRVRRAHVG